MSDDEKKLIEAFRNLSKEAQDKVMQSVVDLCGQSVEKEMMAA